MKLKKSFKHALNMVVHAKLRSWLTILGIVIGVAAVISIVSIGEALEQDLTAQFGNLGGDLLTVTAGRSRASGFGGGRFRGDEAIASGEEINLDRTDVQVLKSNPHIKHINVQISGRVEVIYVAEKGDVTITGVDPGVWPLVTTSDLAEGRMLGPADTNVIVIGGRIGNNFFDKQLGINQLLTVEERLFRIVGILDDESSAIYMPIESAYEILEDKERNVYDAIVLKVKDEDQLDVAIASIQEKLMVVRHVTPATLDFTISSNKERQEQRAEFLGSLTAFLTAIAAVALIVGAVGIANTMFTSVLEKTKEIGIMKAIGARDNDILTIFLVNAALIGLIGGILGIVVGILLSSVLPILMGAGGGVIGRLGSAGAVISVKSMFLALTISLGIGMSSGAVPAFQASRLKPVDALRYE